MYVKKYRSERGQYFLWNYLARLNKKVVLMKFRIFFGAELLTIDNVILRDAIENIMLEFIFISIQEPLPWREQNFQYMWDVWSLFHFLPRDSRFSCAIPNRLTDSEVSLIKQLMFRLEEYGLEGSDFQQYFAREIALSAYEMTFWKAADDDPNFIPTNVVRSPLGKIFPAMASLQK